MTDKIIIDESKWDRKLHCQIFRNSIQPQYCITTYIDVTNFYDYVKRNGLSFTLSFIHSVSYCANQIENFRYRFEDEKVVLYNNCSTEFTYLKGNDELFYYVCVPFCSTLSEYTDNAKRIIDNQKSYCQSIPENDAFQFSAMPWFSYTSVTHTFSGDNTKANPMFDWGKFYIKDNRKLMPFTVQVHHSFVDAVHIAKLVDSLQKFIDELK